MATMKKSTFKRILNKLSEDKQTIAGHIIDELVFMNETLVNLKSVIRSTGEVSVYVDKYGNNATKESAAVKSYNQTIQRYGALLKQLSDMLPKEEQLEEPDDFDEFINSKD